MDAVYIIHAKSSQILIAKEFKENENHLKLQVFLLELNKILSNEQSPFILINNTIFVYLYSTHIENVGTNSDDVIFIALLSEDNLINSVYKTLETIRNALLQSFDNNLTIDNINDNFIQISLALDQYLINGIPAITEPNVFAGLISPYDFTDKLTEKVIGKAKEYDTKTLANYVRERQTTYDSSTYNNENFEGRDEILFDFNDYLDLICDR
jgi:hypothetical protein